MCLVQEDFPHHVHTLILDNIFGLDRAPPPPTASKVVTEEGVEVDDALVTTDGG